MQEQHHGRQTISLKEMEKRTKDRNLQIKTWNYFQRLNHLYQLMYKKKDENNDVLYPTFKYSNKWTHKHGIIPWATWKADYSKHWGTNNRRLDSIRDHILDSFLFDDPYLALASTRHEFPSSRVFQYEVDYPLGTIVDDEFLEGHINWPLTDLLRKHGITPHFLTSGSKSIYVAFFNRRNIPHEAYETFLQHIHRYLVLGGVVDSSNISSSGLRLPLSLHQDTGQLCRFHKTRSKEEATKYLFDIQPDDFTDQHLLSMSSQLWGALNPYIYVGDLPISIDDQEMKYLHLTIVSGSKSAFNLEDLFLEHFHEHLWELRGLYPAPVDACGSSQPSWASGGAIRESSGSEASTGVATVCMDLGWSSSMAGVAGGACNAGDDSAAIFLDIGHTNSTESCDAGGVGDSWEAQSKGSGGSIFLDIGHTNSATPMNPRFDRILAGHYPDGQTDRIFFDEDLFWYACHKYGSMDAAYEAIGKIVKVDDPAKIKNRLSRLKHRYKKCRFSAALMSSLSDGSTVELVEEEREWLDWFANWCDENKGSKELKRRRKAMAEYLLKKCRRFQGRVVTITLDELCREFNFRHREQARRLRNFFLDRCQIIRIARPYEKDLRNPSKPGIGTGFVREEELPWTVGKTKKEKAKEWELELKKMREWLKNQPEPELV